MRDGTYIYYVIQHRTTHKSPHLKPKEPLAEVTDSQWTGSSMDYFWRSEFDKSLRHERCAGHDGWWNLGTSRAALAVIREADARGVFDYRGPYGDTSAARHEFRLVKVYAYQESEVVQ